MTEENGQYRIDKQLARRSFNRAADTYDNVAELQYEIGDRMVERLDYIRQQPRRILDLGAGTGFFTAVLLKRYRKADIVALDIAERMLQRVQGRGGWFRKPAHRLLPRTASSSLSLAVWKMFRAMQALPSAPVSDLNKPHPNPYSHGCASRRDRVSISAHSVPAAMS